MWRAAVAAAVIACAASVTALAASSYSVHVSASSPAVTGHSFSITARGVADQQALLYVYLNRKPCLATWDREAQRVGVYKSGQSYFLVDQGGKMVKYAGEYGFVSGSFTKSYTAHAGTTSEREHACAYLATKNQYGGYRVTSARASTHYKVKP